MPNTANITLFLRAYYRFTDCGKVDDPMNMPMRDTATIARYYVYTSHHNNPTTRIRAFGRNANSDVQIVLLVYRL